MNKKTLVSLLILLIVLVVLFVVFKNQPAVSIYPGVDQGTTTPLDQITKDQTDKAVVYNCDANKFISATYHLPDDALVDLYLSDGTELSLPHVISGSGARYANDDETLVFWNKGNTAFIDESGTTTYANCVTTSD